MRVDQEKINRIKEIQLGMLQEFDSFCRNNGINYSLAYGSMLGAIRHGGYIPWDDDLDVWMLREDYEKFIEKYSSETNKVCNMANTVNYPFYMAKIINNKTELVEEGMSHVNFKYGVYIDIFVIDFLPENKLLRELKLFINYYYYAKLRFKYINTKSKIIKKIQDSINSEKLMLKQQNLFSYKTGKYCKDDSAIFCLLKNKGNRRYIFPSNFIEGFEDVKFENLKCRIFSNYKLILSQCYGDYMQIPKPEDREIHQYILFRELYK